MECWNSACFSLHLRSFIAPQATHDLFLSWGKIFLASNVINIKNNCMAVRSKESYIDVHVVVYAKFENIYLSNFISIMLMRGWYYFPIFAKQTIRRWHHKLYVVFNTAQSFQKYFSWEAKQMATLRYCTLSSITNFPCATSSGSIAATVKSLLPQIGLKYDWFGGISNSKSINFEARDCYSEWAICVHFISILKYILIEFQTVLSLILRKSCKLISTLQLTCKLRHWHSKSLPHSRVPWRQKSHYPVISRVLQVNCN